MKEATIYRIPNWGYEMKISAALRIQGATVDPDAIFECVKVKPTSLKERAKGNLSVWEYRTPFMETLDIMLPIGELMSVISSEAGKKLADLAIAQSAEFCLSCAIYRNTLISETTPILFIDKAALNWISSIRADLDIDIIEMAGEYPPSN